MANYAAEVRMRNFNFFVVIAGAILTGAAQLPLQWSPLAGGLGALIAGMFFCLDVRGRGLHKRSVDQLALLEPLIWRRAGLEGWTEIPRHGGFKVISHNWIYKTFFVTIGVVSAAIPVMRYLGV